MELENFESKVQFRSNRLDEELQPWVALVLANRKSTMANQPTNPFTQILRKVMREQNITGRDLSEKVKITEGSISRILSAQTYPRFKTVQKIAKAIGRHHNEVQDIIDAYHAAGSDTPFTPKINDSLRKYVERLSDEAWLAKDQVVKVMEHRATQSDFRSLIELTLRELGLNYVKDYAENGAATDFLIELTDEKTIAIESRAEIHRNLAQTYGFAFLVLERLSPSKVLIVTPFTANVSCPKGMPSEIELHEHHALKAYLQGILGNVASDEDSLEPKGE